MAATVADFRALFAEFVAVPDTRVDLALDQALRRINAVAWGARADDGQLWLAAHLLAVSVGGSAGAAGPVTSKKVGDVSISFGNTSLGVIGSNSITNYGQIFHQMRREIFANRCA